VSVVVPARDEERGIRRAVISFCEQDYPDLEVVVVDDGSTDGTPGILEELSGRYPHLRVVRVEEPPPGWLGKPNALEQGFRAAGGDVLVFSDADVVYGPGLLRKSVSLLEADQRDMLALLPRFDAEGFLEPVILSTLPLGTALFPALFITHTRWKAFSIGGGVFNMVRRGALEACGAFECLRDAIVDDIGLGYKVKAAGGRVGAAFAAGLLRVRMYEGGRAALDGFVKNVFPAVRRVPWLAAAAPAIGALLSLLPYAGILFAATGRPAAAAPSILALLLMHLLLFWQMRLFQMPVFAACANPVRELLWWWIIVRSFLRYLRQGVVWRGRRYEL